ncbi:MAG: hypothetical protein PF574_02815 [Candidatus Delongbacteria bacterium]|jgi:hypothetical protein|nr:hypothetical protein [Candidatus Delongbacteria bacterium]
MAKRKTSKKKKKATQSSFGDTIFSLLIIGALLYGGYYFFFRDKDSSFFEKSVENIKEKVNDLSKSSQEADSDDVAEKIISSEDDDMNMQFADEITESISGDLDTFEDQIMVYARKYDGLPLREGKDPDKDKATDNSHLICKIYQHAADNSGMYFKGYMQMDEIRKNIHKVKKSSLRNGDLLKLNNGMLAMVIEKNSDTSFKLIYASDSKNAVVVTNYDQLKYYWLKPENFDGFYRLNESVLK